MTESWSECCAGSGVYRGVYDAPAFGEVNALAVMLGELEMAVMSPPIDPDGVYLEALSHLGRITALIVPNSAHTAGLASWKQHCPHAVIYAADAITDSVSKACGWQVQPISKLVCPEGVSLYSAPGVSSGSLLLVCRRGGKTVAYLDELTVWMTDWPRNWLSRALYALSGTRPGLTLNHLFLHWFGRDKRALLKEAEALARTADIICMAHGRSVEAREDLNTVHALIRTERERHDQGR